MDLSNWQTLGEYSFRHVDKHLDTDDIENNGETAKLDHVDSGDPRKDFSGISVPVGSNTYSVKQFIDDTNTDGWMVLHRNEVVFEGYPANHPYSGAMPAGTQHLLMSVTKSLTGTIAGILEHECKNTVNPNEKVLDPTKDVTYYVPDLEKSAYEGVSVRDVLDMRSPVKFSEEYGTAEVQEMEAAAGWAPMEDGWARNTQDFLRSLKAKRSVPKDKDRCFEYRSCEAAVMGWVCERAYQKANRKFKAFPDLVSELLWSKLGAEKGAYITVDLNGTGMFDGGICATLRDLARFGAMICRNGRSLPTPSARHGNPVVSKEWVDDIFTSTDTQEAFEDNPKYKHMRMPDGKYRSMFWAPTANREVVVCIGVYGQMVYINRETEMVGVKLSSRKQAVGDDDKDGGAWGNGYYAFQMFRAIDEHLQRTGPQPVAGANAASQ